MTPITPPPPMTPPTPPITSPTTPTARLRRWVAARLDRLAPADRRADDRGDVPGWVLITLMTAGLVTALWALAGDQLETLFTDAISSVTGPGAG